jgi:hypothetical protein
MIVKIKTRLRILKLTIQISVALVGLLGVGLPVLFVRKSQLLPNIVEIILMCGVYVVYLKLWFWFYPYLSGWHKSLVNRLDDLRQREWQNQVGPILPRV